MELLVALLLVLVAFVACLVPLLGDDAAAGDEGGAVRQRDALASERERIVAALRDLDLDLAMGKVSAEDHGEMKLALEARAFEVMAALDRHATAEDPG